MHLGCFVGFSSCRFVSLRVCSGLFGFVRPGGAEFVHPSLFACGYSDSLLSYLEVNVLRQLGIGSTPPAGRRRMLVLIEWPEHGGIRARDVAGLEGREFLEVRQDVRRLSALDMHRQGLLKRDGRRGIVRVQPKPADPPAPAE